MNKIAKIVFLGISVLYFAGLTIFYIIMATILPELPKYSQSVYCPVKAQSDLKALTDFFGYANQLTFNINHLTPTYAVIMRAKDPTSGHTALEYCGLARAWYENDCGNARVVCSIPGPMFIVNRKEKISIIWINDIKVTDGMNWQEIDCYKEDASCEVNMKPKNKPNQCTDIDPTNEQRVYDKFKISKQSVPTSPHIHGLQIRPAFDGNPLSYFTAKGEHGPGYFSLVGQKDYFSLFAPAIYSGAITVGEGLIKRAKVIQTSNDQLPGMLFYHDHAMRSTKYNVEHGLGGIYIIVDKQVEKALPQGENERSIIFHAGSNNNYKQQSVQQLYISPLKQGQDLYTLNRQQTYRFRFLNTNFDNKFYNIKLVAYYSTVNGKNIPIDPLSEDRTLFAMLDDLANDFHALPFTIIGVDSSLMHQPIHNEEHFNLAPAERVDLLFRLDEALPSNIHSIYIVCNDFNDESKIHIKMKFTVSRGTVAEINPLRESFSFLNVDFYDLKPLLPQVKRHRPIYGYKESTFIIGAHHMFETGASQDSQIGSVEDWHIVNMHIEGHPMHFHLINFQAVKSYSLKKIKGNNDEQCSLYMIDYFRFSGLPQFTGKTNLEICNFLIQVTEQQFHSIYERLGNYQLENVRYTNANGVNSGLDSMTPYDGDTSFSVPSCSLDAQYKYICEDTTGNIQEHEMRWKDTALVPQFTVFVLRIRWASTDYDPAVSLYPYFKIPEEELVEFPGFVYHCHILPHQDNEMMRPIKLNYSEHYLSLNITAIPGKCNRNTWEQSAQCINAKFNCA